MKSHPLALDITELPEGESRLTGEVPSEDLGFTDEEVVLKPPTTVDLRLQRLNLKLLVDGEVTTNVEMTCGRCLERFEGRLSGTMLIQYAPASTVREEEEGEGDVELTVPYEGKIVDLSDDVRQTVVLSVPVKKICRADCRGLCPTCGVNWNNRRCSHGPS